MYGQYTKTLSTLNGEGHVNRKAASHLSKFRGTKGEANRENEQNMSKYNEFK